MEGQGQGPHRGGCHVIGKLGTFASYVAGVGVVLAYLTFEQFKKVTQA